jgi:hypothetical protein
MFVNPFLIPWIYARTLAASLLLFAALTKLIAWEPTAETMLLAGRWTKAFVIQAEVLLAIWLLSGIYAAAARRTAIGLFAVFASYSAYLIWKGIPSCSCFGAIDTSPVLVLSLDILLVISLVNAIPPSNNDLQRVSGRFVGMAHLMLLTGGFLGWLMLGNEAATFGFAGKPLSVSSDVVDFGSNSGNSPGSKTFEIVNHTPQSVSLVGCSARCNCNVGVEFPYRLEPGESVSIPLRIPAGIAPGEFRFPIRFFTDHPKLTALAITCAGRVTQ